MTQSADIPWIWSLISLILSNILIIVIILIIVLLRFQFGKSSLPGKLGVMVQSLCWSQDSSMLVAMQVQVESLKTKGGHANLFFLPANSKYTISLSYSAITDLQKAWQSANIKTAIFLLTCKIQSRKFLRRVSLHNRTSSNLLYVL